MSRLPFRPGLVSVTFRQLAPREIVELAVECGLEGIEWGGDVHVTDAATAGGVRRVGEDAGLAVAAYGSYWRGAGEFGPTLDTAVALGAPTVRVWAGAKGSAEEADRTAVVKALSRACDLAAGAEMTVSLEYHGGTLTDTLDSTLRLVREIDRPGLRLYWQPVPERDHAERLAEVRAISSWLSNVHVFQWTRSHGETVRHPLAEGEWQEVFRAAASSPDERHDSEERFALLEFVPNDEPALLAREAAALRCSLANGTFTRDGRPCPNGSL